jgi:serralysin
MKSKFIIDPQDPFDGLFNMDGAEPFPNFLPPPVTRNGNPFAKLPPVTPVAVPTPTLPAEAVEAQSAQNGSGGLGSVVAETSGGGITINLEFDAAAMAAPASFRAGIEQAASILSSTITNKITVNLQIDYSGSGGGAAAGPDNGQFVNYSIVRADLIHNAAQSDTTFNALPTGSTIQGQSSVVVWNAQLKLFGLLGANDTTTDDGSATFATDINSSLLVGVALHELTHALGRVPYGSQPDIFDFYRFTSAGARLFTDNTPATAAYFSLDGGNTKLADFGRASDPSDFLNSGVQGANDPFNEFYTSTTSQTLTTVDKQILDALGFNTSTPVTTVIESLGSTSLVEVSNNFYLDSISSGTDPELKYAGAPIVTGQVGGWTPIGAEQTSSGYEVAWKLTGADQYTVWNTDSNGNYISSAIGAVSGTDLGLESLETSFHQDLNGDGVIGIPATAIESFGSTSLVEVGNNFYLDNISTGTGPELKYAGAPIVAGQVGGWMPIGAEQTSSGYEVAWKVTSADQYTAWNTDSSGNFISSAIGAVSGTDLGLESLETSFHQDLNGDGVIGIPAIESFGSTKLVEVGNNFYLDSISTGTGPELKYSGAVVVAGTLGGWMPIGAEQTSSGYEVAWKVTGADQYTVWNTDSNGNYVSQAIGTVSGTDLGLESLETSFHQDLNGDGVIGIPAIESFGSTKLVEVGNNFYLDSISTGTGPELKYSGAVVVAGTLGGWMPIGAEQTSSGYEVAWKVTGADQYTVWNTDSNGNYVSQAIGTVSGTDLGLESLETSFHQDLNGDGVIGIPAHTNSAPAIAANVSALPTFTGSTLTLDESSTLSGQIIGFAGDGTLQGSDQIDLRGIEYNSIHSTYDGSTGILAVNDGTNTTDLLFLGNYSQDNFKFADDGGGGSIVYAQPASSQSPLLDGGDATPSQVSGNYVPTADQDTFVFAPKFGQVTLAHFMPATDTIQISKTVFANIDALLSATHDDSHGNAVITDAAHDTITIQNVTTAQLQAHQSDLHLV